jgi:hypothetical protein
MRCDDALALSLDSDAPAEVWLHIQGCSDCRQALAEAQAGRDALTEPFLPPPHLESRVLVAVRAARPEVEVLQPRRRNLAAPLLVGAAATIALLAVLAGLALGSGGNEHTVAFLGTQAAPVARGSLKIVDDGETLRMTLTAQGLPAAETPYELWVSTLDGRRLSAGQFNASTTVPNLSLRLSWKDWSACGVNLLDGSNSGKGTPYLRLADYS